MCSRAESNWNPYLVQKANHNTRDNEEPELTIRVNDEGLPIILDIIAFQ
jgi:hypothetical protein